jgi:hypothetical protein
MLGPVDVRDTAWPGSGDTDAEGPGLREPLPEAGDFLLLIARQSESWNAAL